MATQIEIFRVDDNKKDLRISAALYYSVPAAAAIPNTDKVPAAGNRSRLTTEEKAKLKTGELVEKTVTFSTRETDLNDIKQRIVNHYSDNAITPEEVAAATLAKGIDGAAYDGAKWG